MIIVLETRLSPSLQGFVAINHLAKLDALTHIQGNIYDTCLQWHAGGLAYIIHNKQLTFLVH